jgi:hypothetical protein
LSVGYLSPVSSKQLVAVFARVIYGEESGSLFELGTSNTNNIWFQKQAM